MIEQRDLHKNLPKFNDNSYAHFVTTRTYEHQPYFNKQEFARILIREIQFYKKKYGFTLIGYVIMPDHVHLLLWRDKQEKLEFNVSKVMQGIKAGSARRIIDLMKHNRSEQVLRPTHIEYDGSKPHKRNLRYRIWQPGFYDFNIYNEEKLLEKLNYMHNNPVKAGLVSSPQDYKWSSFKQYYEE